MCVAIYKQEGAKALDRETCEKCWDANDDGAGFAWRRDDGLIEWAKGFMTFKDFWKAYDALPDKDAKEMILHFRIGTHGGNIPQNTHPFPISADVNELKMQRGVCREILMHNGVLPIHPRQKDISDTMELALRIAEDGCGARKSLALLKDFTNDRILIMDAEGIASLGAWHEESKGVWFSNLNWKSYGMGFFGFGDWTNTRTEKKSKEKKGKRNAVVKCSDDCRLYDYDDGLFDGYNEEYRRYELDDAWERWVDMEFPGSYEDFIDAANEFEDGYGDFDADVFIDWMYDRVHGEEDDGMAAGN